MKDNKNFNNEFDEVSISTEDDSVEEDSNKKSPKAVFLEVLIYAVIFYACIYLIPNYVIQRTVVDGPSMENTLHNEENLLVEKISFRLDALDRFDIIVFYPYGHDVEEYFVKRIIGLPGETVQIKGNDIYINGEVIEEDYGKDPITFAGIAKKPITLGDGEYFVLGDNREISFDSRYEEIGVISKSNIGGRAILRIWPLNKFGLID